MCGGDLEVVEWQCQIQTCFTVASLIGNQLSVMCVRLFGMKGSSSLHISSERHQPAHRQARNGQSSERAPCIRVP